MKNKGERFTSQENLTRSKNLQRWLRCKSGSVTEGGRQSPDKACTYGALAMAKVTAEGSGTDDLFVNYDRKKTDTSFQCISRIP